MDKARELRCRRQAHRQGFRLSKSCGRDPQHVEYGLYALVDMQTSRAVNPRIDDHWFYSWSLDQVRPS